MRPDRESTSTVLQIASTGGPPSSSAVQASTYSFATSNDLDLSS